MERSFFEYQPLKEEDIKSIWEKSIIILDTNVLLNLYRYSENTSSSIIESLNLIKDRVWLPFQTGFEFNKNRLDVIIEQKNDFQSFYNEVSKIISKVENKNRNPFFSEELTSDLDRINHKIEEEVKLKTESYEELFNNDHILSKINDIFADRIGEPFSEKKLSEIFKEGIVRYNKKIPPGYCDLKKPEPERYGDLIIWKQIIEKSKSENQNVIFVLDDGKEDWWRIISGKKISPRPELLREFYNNTKNKVHFYLPFQFIEFLNDFYKASLPEKAINEVKNYMKSNDEYNIVRIRITLKGDFSAIDEFAKKLSLNGYNVSAISDIDLDSKELHITIPNFGDLIRRFETRYLSSLEEYDIKLVDKDVKYEKS